MSGDLRYPHMTRTVRQFLRGARALAAAGTASLQGGGSIHPATAQLSSDVPRRIHCTANFMGPRVHALGEKRWAAWKARIPEAI